MAHLNDTIFKGRATAARAAVLDAEVPRLDQVRRLLLDQLQGEWDADEFYYLGQIVSRNNSLYAAKQDNTAADPASSPDNWRLVLQGATNGTGGASAYSYIGYASDASGTGFTMVFNASLDYIAIKATTSPISSPGAGDFAGLWKNYKGAPGDQGDQGDAGASAYTYIAYASDNTGTGFTNTFNASLDYIAIKAMTTPISAPAAGDFTGLWKKYGGVTVTGTAPITVTAGVVAINAGSANTANYVVQRDGSGNFAAGKITLGGTTPAVDHISLAGAVTIGYDGTQLAISTPVGTARVNFSPDFSIRYIDDETTLKFFVPGFGAGALMLQAEGKVIIANDDVAGLYLPDLENGVLMVAGDRVVSGGSTDALGEGTANLYYTAARVRGCTLTGLSTGTGGTVSAADSILTAFGRIENRLALNDAKVTGSDRALKTGDTFTGPVAFAPAAATSGSPTLLTVTGPAHTTLATGTEAADVNLNLGRVVQFTVGALTTQRAVVVGAPSYAFTSASTLTHASTLAITGAPAAWTNATIVNASALRIQPGAVTGGNTNAYGLFVEAPTGAVNNFAAYLSGAVTVALAAGQTVAIGNVFRITADDVLMQWPDTTWHKISRTIAAGQYLWDVNQSPS